MARENLTSLLTSFTPDGEFLSILLPNGIVKIWNTSNGSLFAECKRSDGGPFSYSCMSCSFIGKKRKKERTTFLLALGTNDGDVLAIDAFTGDVKWKSSRCYPGGVVGLAFVNKGRTLLGVGTNGVSLVMKSESGELIRELKASKKPVSSLAFSTDENILAIASSKTRVLSLENGEELLSFPNDLGPVQYLSLSNNGKSVVTSGFGEKHLQVWRCNLSSKSVNIGPVLSMRHPPFTLECKNYCKEKEDGLVVLAISVSGVVYVWNLKTISQDEVNPAKITVKDKKTETDKHKGGSSAKKNCTSIFAARLHALEDERRVKALIAYGSIESPQFSIVNVSDSGKKIAVTASDENVSVIENGITAVKDLHDMESEATVASAQHGKIKKRTASDMDIAATGDESDTDHGEAMDGVLVEDDVNEPTMGEKLESLNLQVNDKSMGLEKQESPRAKPPSADSVNVLLRQALHADDRALLLDCLYNQDEKVIANSISQLKPSDVLKLLHSLLSVIQSRGAILACALRWLKSLLLQHASGIMSHESSLVALNSLYQLIESRVSTFQPALQLSSFLDFLYAGVLDDSLEEETIQPVIYEDKDESDEEESEDAMDSDQEDIQEGEAFDGAFDDLEGSDGMSE